MATDISGWRPHKPETWTARFGTLIADTPASRYAGYWKNGRAVCEDYTLAAGTRVKIVMFSRFGDVGITAAGEIRASSGRWTNHNGGGWVRLMMYEPSYWLPMPTLPETQP